MFAMAYTKYNTQMFGINNVSHSNCFYCVGYDVSISKQSRISYLLYLLDKNNT